MAEEAALIAWENDFDIGKRNVRTTLEWIGFQFAVQRERISNESYSSFGDIQMLEEVDVTNLTSSFAKRTPAVQRILFGQHCIKKLKALIHWCKDFCWCSCPVTIDALNNITFNAALDTAARRQEIRRQQMELLGEVMKEASPGNLMSELKWHKREPAFKNYLLSAFGVDGVPLSYVIRSSDSPDHDGTFADFTDECTACAPLNRPAFDANKRQVHQMIVSFTHWELSEDWVKPVKG